MKKTQVKEEVLKMKFEEIYDRFQKKKLTSEEASELLGISMSTFYRKRQRHDSEGFDKMENSFTLMKIFPKGFLAIKFLIILSCESFCL